MGELWFLPWLPVCWKLLFWSQSKRRFYGRRRLALGADVAVARVGAVMQDADSCRGLRRKPDAVRHEVMRLKALMPGAGCRRIALVFNRLHSTASLGKSFVAQVVKAHQWEIAQLRRDMHNARPKDVAVNKVWALDLTFFTDDERHTHIALGIVDHGSRLNVCLQRLTVRNSWMVLGWLCMAIAKYGKPQRVRTDNEAIFTGFVFRTFLKLVGIRQERTRPHSPWQNGRIERFFGG